ncbi:MAG: cell division protein SepF [Candidatus Diapherotrites archaeon]|uniref:Cell division protein SepF n=1 Tax=Candidatus Iainarchaeum sp. TaxID=3101447 RepID=A0A939CA45_9ARCH|nr:cell division protein SepF [Candidatus Diapherotrites archaeon]
MAFLEKVMKKPEGIDIEEFLNNLDTEDETLYEDADAFVKPFTLATDTDTATVLNEAKSGNIVLLNIGDLSKRNAIKLKEIVTKIKSGIDEIDGDIARISQDRVLVTPSKVKIIKKKEAP